MAYVVKPPTDFRNPSRDYRNAVFLGGSIDLGKADDWQKRVEAALADIPVLIMNPRRDNWDWSTPHDPTPGTLFHQQVQWEQDALAWADTKVFYFAGGSRSVVTMLEFGQYLAEDHLHVYCPPNFWRWGNVKFMCDQYNIKCHDDEAEFIRQLRIDVIPT